MTVLSFTITLQYCYELLVTVVCLLYYYTGYSYGTQNIASSISDKGEKNSVLDTYSIPLEPLSESKARVHYRECVVNICGLVGKCNHTIIESLRCYSPAQSFA